MKVEINKEYVIKLTQSDYDKLCSELFNLQHHAGKYEYNKIIELYEILHSQSL